MSSEAREGFVVLLDNYFIAGSTGFLSPSSRGRRTLKLLTHRDIIAEDVLPWTSFCNNS